MENLAQTIKRKLLNVYDRVVFSSSSDEWEIARDEREWYPSLSDVELGARQVRGVNPTPVDWDGDSMIMDQHFVQVTPRFGVRVSVFQFVPTDEEVERSGLC